MLSKLLASAFVLLIVLKLFFPPQLAQVKKWVDGIVNAMLIAIVLSYLLQLILVLT